MPQSWLIGAKKRSIEKDKFYDPPNIIWEKINQGVWPYKRYVEFYHRRDLALMSTLYLTCSRVIEIVRGQKKVGELEGVKKNQFVKVGNFLMLRNVPNVKQHHTKGPQDWKEVESTARAPTIRPNNHCFR